MRIHWIIASCLLLVVMAVSILLVRHDDSDALFQLVISAILSIPAGWLMASWTIKHALKTSSVELRERKVKALQATYQNPLLVVVLLMPVILFGYHLAISPTSISGSIIPVILFWTDWFAARQLLNEIAKQNQHPHEATDERST